MKRWIALFLAVILTLPLMACGRENGEDAAAGVFYTSEQMEIPAQFSWITDTCAAGDAFYLLGASEEKLASGYVRRNDDRLLRVSPEDGLAHPLAAYQPLDIPEAQRVFILSSGLRLGEEETLWQTGNLSAMFFDLPEGFDEENGDWTPYSTGGLREWVLRRLDADGRELFRFEVDDAVLESQLNIGAISDLVMDGDGEITAIGETGVGILTKEGQVRFTIQMEEPVSVAYPARLILLGDGRVGVAEFAEEGTGYYIRLQLINKETRDWGRKYLLPAFGGVYDGAGDVLFYYQAGDELRAWMAETEDAGSGEKVLNWADAGIDYNELNFLAVTGGGQLLAVTSDQGDSYMYSSRMIDPKLFLLRAMDGSDRKMLTYATLGLWSSDRTAILEFNRTNPDYQIVVKDYMDYSPNGSREDAIMRLATEIGAGKMPDILVIENMPVEQWASAGLLEDLWPWIDKDPEISREDLMERVFQAMEIDGKLYEVSDTFSMSTVFGLKDVVGDRMTWTPEDMEAAMAAMPEAIGTDEGGVELLLNMLRLDWGQFVDWKRGKCSFDSEEFKALLEFCGRFPESVSGHSWNRVNAGQQLVATIYPHTFETVQEANAIVNGEAAFVGYPNPWGKVGSSFLISRTVSMCSACKYKEGAWEFMRTLLLPHDPARNNYDQNNYFYTNKTDFQRAAKKAMSSSISYTMIYGDVSIHYDKVTQEEYDQLMALYDAMDTVYRCDLSLEDIIGEVAGAYFAGDKTVDETAALIQNRASLYVGENT